MPSVKILDIDDLNKENVNKNEENECVISLE